ncbi:MAG: hypothetical protein R3E96_09350 [Planctomycetota bacterium]
MIYLLLPLALSAPQVEGPSIHHPSDALAYFEIADVQAAYRAYQASSYGEMLADPQVRAALEKAFRQEAGSMGDLQTFVDRNLEVLTDGVWSEIKPALAGLNRLSGSVTLHGMTPKQVVETFRSDGGGHGMRMLMDHLHVHVRAEFLTPGTAETLLKVHSEKLLASPGGDQAPIQQVQVAGHAAEILSLGASDGPVVSLVREQDVLHFILGSDPAAYLDQVEQQAGALTSASRFADGRSRVGGQEGTTLMEFSGNYAQAFYHLCPEREYIVPVLDFIETMTGPDFDMILRGGYWRLSFRHPEATRPGMFITQAWQPDLKLGPYDQLFTGTPLHAKSLADVAEDSVVASAMSVDQEVLVQLLRNIFKDVEEDPFLDWEQQYGFRPEQDILANLGNDWISTMPLESIGVSSLPGVSYWIDLKDRRAMQAGLQKLTPIVEAESDGEFSLVEKRYRNHVMFTLKSTDPGNPLESMLQPTVVLLEDRMLITLSRQHAIKEIKRATAPEEERQVHAHFGPASMPPGAIVEMAYSDWAKVLGRLYTSAKSFLPMILGGESPDDLGGVPVDLMALPDPTLFVPFFEPTMRHRERINGGVRVYVESSIGPELSTLMVGGGASMWLLMANTGVERVETVEPVREVPVSELPPAEEE